MVEKFRCDFFHGALPAGVDDADETGFFIVKNNGDAIRCETTKY